MHRGLGLQLWRRLIAGLNPHLRRAWIGIFLGLLAHSVAWGAEPKRNGFVLTPSSIAATEILGGGPPRDGIPALDHPASLSAKQADWGQDELVMGIVVSGKARAYPVAILNWHELVNDTLGGEPILVSFCPLCGTGMIFDRRIDGAARTFGVSGLLYHSDLLMYDHESESLWSQISAKAVTGPSLGQRLPVLRSKIDHWGNWRRDHPDTTVLSRSTGHPRNYDRTPYGSYSSSKKLYFPAPLDPRFHPKMPTLGLRIPGRGARAYPASELAASGGRVVEQFLGRDVRVSYDSELQLFRVEAPAEVEVIEGFWFAWAAFHPKTSVYRAADESAPRDSRPTR